MSAPTSEEWDRFSMLRERLQLMDTVAAREALAELREESGECLVASLLSLHFALPEVDSHELGKGDYVDDLLLGDQLGAGGMGVVFEATQILGNAKRQVAVKLIKPGLWRAAPEEARERFFNEISALAALQYDGIARMYSVGEYPDPLTSKTVPYLVLELVRGARSITDFARERDLRVADRIVLFQRVCRAVQHAHEHRIIHRDLKPPNILVDSQGRTFIVDFGLAQTCDVVLPGASVVASGTPAYMSPEQVVDQYGPISAKSDAYALGVVFYELLTGERPYSVSNKAPWTQLAEIIATASPPLIGKLNPNLTGPIEALVAAALAKEPARRISVAQLADRLEDLSRRSLSDDSSASSGQIGMPYRSQRWTDSPYPGLAAFTAEQAPIFFGRDREVDLLAELIQSQETRFVAVVGATGAGKSSLVIAGLLPRLCVNTNGDAPWSAIVFRPGDRGGDPFLALAYALQAKGFMTGRTEREIAEAMRIDPARLPMQLSELFSNRSVTQRLLLVVDQLDELFTPASTCAPDAFLTVLEKVATHGNMRVVVTVRSDFFGRAIEEPVFARLMRSTGGAFPLQAPRVEALRQMIARPAAAAGLKLQSELVQRLLDDLGAAPGSMPLMAFSLNQMYERATDGCLTIASYEALGGVKGVINERAKLAIRALPATMAKALPSLFSQLVDVNGNGVATRRRAEERALSPRLKKLAEVLSEARLLVSGEGESRQPTLEFVHDTVLEEWPQLAIWIDRHAESLRTRRYLEAAAREWENAGRPWRALRSGLLLRRYLAAPSPLSKTARYFLIACKRRRAVFRASIAMLAIVATVAFGIFLNVDRSDHPPRLAARGLFINWGLLPVQKPVMVMVSPGVRPTSSSAAASFESVSAVPAMESFEIGRYEVTQEEFALFAAATERARKSDPWSDGGRANHPVTGLRWSEAVEYASWLSEKTGLEYRLPTNAEWEYAATAGSGTIREWLEKARVGDQSACGVANMLDRKTFSAVKERYPKFLGEPFACEDDFAFTAPVGQLRANSLGLHDMLGNVWEWVQDCLEKGNESAAQAAKNRTDKGGATETKCSRRVIRGGGWSEAKAGRPQTSPDLFSSQPAANTLNTVGFRLARTL